MHMVALTCETYLQTSLCCGYYVNPMFIAFGVPARADDWNRHSSTPRVPGGPVEVDGPAAQSTTMHVGKCLLMAASEKTILP